MAYADHLEYVGAIAAALITTLALLAYAAAKKYDALKKQMPFDLDAYVRQPNPKTIDKLKVVLLHHLNVGRHKITEETLPLDEAPSPFVDNLRVTSRAGTRVGAKPYEAPPGHLVVGTIRMGFGHHRIAYAATSWALGTERATYFHDLLNIDSAESKLIIDMDKMYSKGSRLATEIGGPVERAWGALTKSGDENSLRVFFNMVQHLGPVLRAVPRETPIIATHGFVGMLAVSLGFENVINLVIDNHAQWFIVVPGAYNLVQGPSNYHNLLRMGVPADRLELAGHWIPKDMVDGIEADCGAREARAAARKPLRLLIPVGGAGAQKSFVCSLVKALKPRIEEGSVQLMLNAGDHEHMRVAFVAALEAIGAAYGTVNSIDGVRGYAERLRKGKEPVHQVTLFSFADYFPAVATTDILARVTDVLCCKPSELAFYPVPKLMIRRVGDHEAYSALRASELGDGTLELREVADALAYVGVMEEGPELLKMMNQSIVRNKGAGVYDGCKRAIELAEALAEGSVGGGSGGGSVGKKAGKKAVAKRASKSPARR